MLPEDELYINKIVQGNISVMRAICWLNEMNLTRQREILSLTARFLQQANPTQEGIDFLLAEGKLNGMPEVREVFTDHPYATALDELFTFTEEDAIGSSILALIEIYRYFDEIQRKTVCKDGCDHEWHNLFWELRTTDVERLVNFYSLLGLKFEHDEKKKGGHYGAQSGQSVLKIFVQNKTNQDRRLGLHLTFKVKDLNGVIKKLQDQQVTIAEMPIETSRGIRAVINDPDGRKIELYKA